MFSIIKIIIEIISIHLVFRLPFQTVKNDQKKIYYFYQDISTIERRGTKTFEAGLK
jgi:hypothetical protein